MQAKQSTGRVRIVRTPKGEAPSHIRAAWIGLVLPCDPIMGFSGSKEKGVLSQKESNGMYGVSIPQDAAIQALERSAPAAAAWWKAHGFPHPDGYFGFAAEEVEVISGVTHQKIIHVTDEMQGDPYR